MKLRRALLVSLGAIVCMSLWRTRGNYFDRYWVNEYPRTRQYCTVVPFPKHPVLDQLRFTEIQVYHTIGSEKPLVAVYGDGVRPDGSRGSIGVTAFLNPAIRNFSPVTVRSGDELVNLESAGLKRDLTLGTGCECGNFSPTARCEDTTYRSTGPYAPQDCRLSASKSMEALYTARRKQSLTSWENLFNPLDIIWFSHNGVFTIDFYRRGKPDQILTSVRGGWWGDSHSQSAYAEHHSLWISDRYFLIPSKLTYRSFLLCDFGGL